MIYQKMPRKAFGSCTLDKESGFYIEGKDYNDCLKQLSEWCENHKEKWVYYHDCGLGPAKSIPVARNIFEVLFYDAEPASPVLFSRLFQRGSDNKREIDALDDKEKEELLEKQLLFFSMLGASYRGMKL